MKHEKKYRFHFCYNGRKGKKAWTDEVEKIVFDNFEWYVPYDIIDCDEHNIWFDYDDCDV